MEFHQVIFALPLIVLGIAIGVAGLWLYARFQAIAAEAKVGAAIARHYVLAPDGLLHVSGDHTEQFGEVHQPLPLLVSGELQANPDPTASVNGDTRSSLAPAPRPHSSGHSLALDGLSNAVGGAGPGPNDADLQRFEEAIADCTEAIRLDPDNSRLYLERAEARTSLDHYEGAVADYDRAIQFDPENAAAYLGRCRAKSELGLHEKAIADDDQAVRLDEDAESASGDG